MKTEPTELVIMQNQIKKNTGKEHLQCVYHLLLLLTSFPFSFTVLFLRGGVGFWLSKDFIECGRHHGNVICSKISVFFYDSSPRSLKSPADCLSHSRCLRNICWIEYNISIFKEILYMKTQVHSHACVLWLLERLVCSICFSVLNKNTSGNLVCFLLKAL